MGKALVLVTLLGLSACGGDKFASEGRSVTGLDGWTLHDPFTRKTNFYSTPKWCTAPSPGEGYKLALYIEENTKTEVFMMVGDPTAVGSFYETCFSYTADSPVATVSEPVETSTLDGTPVSLYTADMSGGAFDGTERFYILGRGEKAGTAFVVMGGGTADSFSIDVATEILDSIKL